MNAGGTALVEGMRMSSPTTGRPPRRVTRGAMCRTTSLREIGAASDRHSLAAAAAALRRDGLAFTHP